MTNISVAALQLPLGGDEQTNIYAVSGLIAEAAEQGAQIILPPELFAGPYFCKTEDEALFALAQPVGESTPVLAMQKLAKQQPCDDQSRWRDHGRLSQKPYSRRSRL